MLDWEEANWRGIISGTAAGGGGNWQKLEWYQHCNCGALAAQRLKRLCQL